jgi:O-antigen biosynthesis protein
MTSHTAASPVTFSIVMPTYNTPVALLEATLNSVYRQTYPHWELCICDDASTDEATLQALRSITDARVKVHFSPENQHISLASNAAAAMATGDFIALLDHDDEYVPEALETIATAMAENPNAEMLYSDEIILDEQGETLGLHLKPQFSPEFLLSNNYVCHLLCFKRSLFYEVGEFRKGFEGSQDHDLVLRLSEKAKQIVAIPKVLYHWKAAPNSVVGSSENKPYAWFAGQRAVQEALDRRGIAGEAKLGKRPFTYVVERHLNEATRQTPIGLTLYAGENQTRQELEQTLVALQKYAFVETLSLRYVLPAKLAAALPEALSQAGFSFQETTLLAYENESQLTALLNQSAQHLAESTPVLAFMQAGTLLLDEATWLQLLAHALDDNLGAVGCKELNFRKNRVLSAGYTVFRSQQTLIPFFNTTRTKKTGYLGRLDLPCNVWALGAKLLITRRCLWQAHHGLDDGLPSGLAFPDYTLRLHAAGFRLLLLNQAPVSLVKEVSLFSDKAFKEAEDRFKRKHQNQQGLLPEDPYLNPHLIVTKQGYLIPLLADGKTYAHPVFQTRLSKRYKVVLARVYQNGEAKHLKLQLRKRG